MISRNLFSLINKIRMVWLETKSHKFFDMHGNIKVLLIAVATLISIAAAEVAVLVACLALSACVDEIRIQILFKERRQLVDMIKELRQLSNKQMDKIVELQGMNNEQTNKIKTLSGVSQQLRDEIKTLSGVSQQLRDEINEQTNKIVELQKLSQRLENRTKEQTNKIVELQGVSQLLRDEINEQTNEIVELQGVSQRLRDEINEQTDKIVELQRLSKRLTTWIMELWSDNKWQIILAVIGIIGTGISIVNWKTIENLVKTWLDR